MRVLVLGAGVSGLCSAIELARRGHTVTIWARERSPDTTSDRAAALWFPFEAAPVERVAAWSAVTYRALLADPVGLRLVPMRMLFDAPPDRPAWAVALDAFEIVAADVPGYTHMYRYVAPIIDTSRYLPHLHATAQRHGVVVEQRTVTDMAEPLAVAAVVVNCTGLGSHELLGDRDLLPVRGQVLRMERLCDTAVTDQYAHNALAHVLPRIDDMVVGGVVQPGNWNTEVDPADTEDILQRAARIEPAVQRARVLSVAVGLRPVRSTVRLEAEPAGRGRWLVHNYGHGGSGFTVAWGCAAEVADLVERVCAEG